MNLSRELVLNTKAYDTFCRLHYLRIYTAVFVASLQSGVHDKGNGQMDE